MARRFTSLREGSSPVATREESRQIESHVPECRECQRKLSCVIALSEQGLPSWRSEKRGFQPLRNRLDFRRRR